MQLPDYNFLPAPLWLITVLHLVTLTLHFIAMNFLVGGIIAVLWGKFTDRWDEPVVQKFVKLFPTALAATVSLGVAPLLFLQLVFHRQVYAASIVSAWFWLGIIGAVILAYYLLYAAALSQKTGRGSRPIYLTIALVALLYVSFVYSSIFSMAERPDLYTKLYAADQSGLVINPDFHGYLYRWLHMIFGAITVGGFFVGWLGKDDKGAYEVGRTFFLWGTVVAGTFGTFYLISLGPLLRPFMRTPGIWALTLGIILSAGSLHFYFKKKFVGAAAMLFVSLFGMVVTRHYVRLLNLAGSFEPATIPIRPQWSIFVVFLIFFVIAIGAVWYMVRLFFEKGGKK
jgi:hypothetical protein